MCLVLPARVNLSINETTCVENFSVVGDLYMVSPFLLAGEAEENPCEVCCSALMLLPLVAHFPLIKALLASISNVSL